MKKLSTLVCCCLLWACSDPQLTPTATNGTSATHAATLGPGSLAPYEWTRKTLPDPYGYPVNDPSDKKGFIFANNTAYWFVGSLLEYQYKLNVRTQEWERLRGDDQLSNPFFGGYNYLCSKGSRYFIGLREQAGDPYGDERTIYWRDVATGESGHLADFPGTLNQGYTVFAAGEKLYLIGGRKGNLVSNQYWEYSFATNQWTDKGGLPGGRRAYCAVHVIDNKVYYGLGYDVEILNGQVITRYKDWLVMNAGSTVAATQADFPGTARMEPEGFVINSKVFVGWGKGSAGSRLTDFWEFNTKNNTWTSKPNCPSAQSGPLNMRAFAIGDNGYFIRGCLGEFWRYSNTLEVVQ